MKDVIIVGNGASVLEKPNGVIIDSYSTVVRINDFKLAGYEINVGTKTDVLFTCILDKYTLEELNRFPCIILSLIRELRDDKEFWKSDEEFNKIMKLRNVDDDLDWKYAKLVGKEANIKWEKFPSTGLLAIFYFAVSLNRHVTITGFDNFANGNPRYYEPNRVHEVPRHDGIAERDFIHKLYNQNKLSYL